MSKQPRKDFPKYTRLERRAEAKIDRFLKRIGANSSLTILDELKKLA